MSPRWAPLALALALGACTSIVDGQIGAGLGASCSVDEQCQGAACFDGICAVECAPDGSCPAGTLCAQAICQVPLSAGFVYPGPVGQDALTFSFESARQALTPELAYLDSTFVDALPLASEAVAAAEELIAQGSTVIVATLPAHGTAFADLADRHPDVSVLVHGGRVTRPNLVSFDTRAYQAYFLAGIAAARKTSSGRLCFVSSVVTPSVVARVNGFVLGARSVAPDTLVEVVWIGAWHDTDPPVNGQARERRETLAMIGRGCDVVAHALDNNIPVGTVAQEASDTAFAVGANVPTACELAPGRCLGSVVFHWAPVLAPLVDDAHRGRFGGGRVLEGIRLSDAETPLSFPVPTNLIGAQAIAAELDAVRTILAGESGVGSVFDGPIRSTGRCEAETGRDPCVAEGERLSDGGLDGMCWLAEGAITFDGTSDVPALVPEEGDCVPTEG